MRAIDADACESYFWEHLDDNGMAAAMNAINDMPTIEPERKKGRWINIRHDNIAECDQCRITGRAWMNFCFDCGADMREGEG